MISFWLEKSAHTLCSFIQRQRRQRAIVYIFGLHPIISVALCCTWRNAIRHAYIISQEIRIGKLHRVQTETIAFDRHARIASLHSQLRSPDSFFMIRLNSIFGFESLTKFLLTSSWAFSAFLSPRSNELTASFSAFTNSAGDFCDFPNNGMLTACTLYACVQMYCEWKSPVCEWTKRILLQYALCWLIDQFQLNDALRLNGKIHLKRSNASELNLCSLVSVIVFRSSFHTAAMFRFLKDNSTR